MIKVTYTTTSGWFAAVRGMRNPMNSWDRSDSRLDSRLGQITSGCIIGENDLDLMKRLSGAGREHRKFMRMIHVQMDILAPLYWWKEFDTYKVGTTANSCSTMHKLTAKPFELSDFSTDQIIDCFLHSLRDRVVVSAMDSIRQTVSDLNTIRNLYLDSKDERLWYAMVQLLPSSYNQKRTVDFDYETALTMIQQREGHKLKEWRDFVLELKSLPYMGQFMEG